MNRPNIYQINPFVPSVPKTGTLKLAKISKKLRYLYKNNSSKKESAR